MIVFSHIREMVAAGSGVRLDAHALTQPQWVELAAAAAQTGARIEVARADKLTPVQRQQMAAVGGALILFDFGGCHGQG